MGIPFSVVNRDIIAQAVTFDGRPVTVCHVQFNNEIRGLGLSGYTVDVGQGAEHGPVSVGFATEDEALHYLGSSTPEHYTTFDGVGSERQETRVGLGIPDGMIRYAAPEVPPPLDSPPAPLVVDATRRANRPRNQRKPGR